MNYPPAVRVSIEKPNSPVKIGGLFLTDREMAATPPWNDPTKSITTKVEVDETAVEAINTIPEKTTMIRSTISITNGKSDGDEETIPNLYEAVKTALSNEQGQVKTDAIQYLTKTNGDITLTLGEYSEETQQTTETKYSLKKVVQAINILANRTRHMVDPENDVDIDILVNE